MSLEEHFTLAITQELERLADTDEDATIVVWAAFQNGIPVPPGVYQMLSVP